MRTYEFDNYDFRGIGRFNDVLIGAKDSYIYDLETAATHDHETDIDAYFELGEVDFGLPQHKRMRGMYFECDNGASLTALITDLAGTASTYTLTEETFTSFARTLIDKAFSVKISNVSGEQLSIWKLHTKINTFAIGGM
jgi:hypothetical protein